MNKNRESDTTKETTSQTSSTKAEALAETPETKAKSKFHDANASELAQGFQGSQVDTTPNENYSFLGVITGAATPETDLAHGRDLRRANLAKAMKKLPRRLDLPSDDENEQGFYGVAVDPTPNRNYTFAGVTHKLPTPETDEEAAAEAYQATHVEE
jgi:hypothetical protein